MYAAYTLIQTLAMLFGYLHVPQQGWYDLYIYFESWLMHVLVSRDDVYIFGMAHLSCAFKVLSIGEKVCFSYAHSHKRF